MDDRMIQLDDEFAVGIGFTSDRFDGYLWKKGEVVIVSPIISLQPNRGHFSDLVRRIEAQGFRVHVPTPMPHMQAILTHWGYTPHDEPFAPEMDDFTPCEVWAKPVNPHVD